MHIEILLLQQARYQGRDDRAVFGHKHLDGAIEVGHQRWRVDEARRADPASGRKPEPAALGQIAVDADRSTHDAAEPLANRQPQSGAAVLSRDGGVGLNERIEELPLRRRTNADAGIDDIDPQFQLAVRQGLVRYLYGDAAGIGELDGIVPQVEQDLADAIAIALQPMRKIVRNDCREL